MRIATRRLIPLLALAAAALLPAAELRAQTALELGTWTQFEWFDGVGPISTPFDGFFLSALSRTRVRIADAFDTGDAFDVFVNGSLFFSTGAVLAGIATDAGDGDSAWTDERLSRGEFFVEAGEYRIDIALREDSGFGYGEGFIRADAVTVTPEPAGLVLLMGGLAGLAALRRRREHDGLSSE